MSFLGETPPYDEGSFAAIVTGDASPAGGASKTCSDNVRKAWPRLFELGATEAGRKRLTSLFRLCPNSAPESVSDVWTLAFWLQSSMDYMAMGSYPYPSSYILNGDGVLPPYPMREMCKPLAQHSLGPDELLQALSEGTGVFYNYSGALTCFDTHGSANNATTEDGHLWDYLFCSELTQPMSRDGKRDMFWSQPFSLNGTEMQCQSQWGIRGRPRWATVLYGGWTGLEEASNIVFSNGELDPWRGGGVTRNETGAWARDIIPILIPEVGHHIDLMFSNPNDTPAVRHARDTERRYLAKWIQQHHARGPAEVLSLP